MRNKGFTLIELITTIALSSVVIILLLNIIILIKEIYIETNLKTELYVNQSNLSNVLNEKFKNNELYSSEDCSESNQIFCYSFSFNNDETIELSVTENKIKFGNYVYNIPENVTVDMKGVFYTSSSHTSSIYDIYQLKIPIVSKLYPNIDFGINLVYFN